MILDGALAEFSEKGFDGARIDEHLRHGLERAPDALVVPQPPDRSHALLDLGEVELGRRG